MSDVYYKLKLDIALLDLKKMFQEVKESLLGFSVNAYNTLGCS